MNCPGPSGGGIAPAILALTACATTTPTGEPAPPLPFATKSVPGAHDYLAPDKSEIRLLPEMSGGGLAHCTLPPGRVSHAVRHKTDTELA